MCFEQPISKTEYQWLPLRYWHSAHWRTESLPSVWRKSSNDGVSERRGISPWEQMVEWIDRNPADACGLETKTAQRQWNKQYSGAPLSKTSWRGVFLLSLKELLDYFFKILLTNRHGYDIHIWKIVEMCIYRNIRLVLISICAQSFQSFKKGI